MKQYFALKRPPNGGKNMYNKITTFHVNREKKEWERRTNMRKLWVKAWMTLDGVFDAESGR